MQRDDVLRIGSSTKIFTAVIILKQVETGQLGLEDPLSKWSPEIPEADAITVRNLLNHTSGIEEIISKGIMKSIIPSTVWSEDDLLKLIASSPLKFTPGSQWEYSNSNYILLGMIAERVSGKTMLQLYHEVIIDPLNLKHTCFVPYEPAPAALVAGYERDLSHIPGMLDIAPGNTSWATLAFSSGAMVSTAEDLGAFLDHLMAGDLLSAASMQEMTTFVASVNPGIPAEDGYGLGLMRLDVNGQELIGHIGWFMGATSIAMASPDRGYTIVITSNLSTPDLVEVLARLQDVILIQTNRTSGANHGHAEI
jgi:D-alanyl-D-alanine carboxypeptidase